MARLDRSRLQRLGLPRGASERTAHNWPAACIESQRRFQSWAAKLQGLLRHVRSKFPASPLNKTGSAGLPT